MIVEYESVNWVKEGDIFNDLDQTGVPRWLGARAREATKEFEIPGDAMREFEKITGKQVTDEGCNCCGAPHRFSWEERGKSVSASGERCLNYLYPDEKPKSLREFYEGRK